MVKKYSPEKERLVIDLYTKDQMSLTQISKIHKLDRATMAEVLEKNGIEQRKLGSHLRKFPLNEQYFDDIDSEDKSYFLGLLYADGCNSRSAKNKKSIKIELQEGDKDILSAFSRYLYDGNEFLYYVKQRRNNQAMWRLCINSPRVSQRIANLGCVSRKSLVLEFPNWLIDPELQRHFIRGYFDGDGALYGSKSNNSYTYIWQLTSTSQFCSKVSDIIRSHYDIHINNRLCCPEYNDTTTGITIKGTRQVEQIMDWLYKDATIYLERKHQKYLELKAWIKNVDDRMNNPERHINQYD
jgi:predicted HTH domain antitoxin